MSHQCRHMMLAKAPVIIQQLVQGVAERTGSTLRQASLHGSRITVIRIVSSRMLLATGFLRKVFEIFETYKTSIDMVTTSEVGVSMSIDNKTHLNEIISELKKYGTVDIDNDMCIICVVGDLEWGNVGYESLITSAMSDIPVRMVSYGGSYHNISFLIRSDDKAKALKALSEKLFND